MATYAFTIKPAGTALPHAGQVLVAGKAVSFAANEMPDEKSNPLHAAAAALFVATGGASVTSGTVTVTATSS